MVLESICAHLHSLPSIKNTHTFVYRTSVIRGYKQRQIWYVRGGNVDFWLWYSRVQTLPALTSICTGCKLVSLKLFARPGGQIRLRDFNFILFPTDLIYRLLSNIIYSFYILAWGHIGSDVLMEDWNWNSWRKVKCRQIFLWCSAYEFAKAHGHTHTHTQAHRNSSMHACVKMCGG